MSKRILNSKRILPGILVVSMIATLFLQVEVKASPPVSFDIFIEEFAFNPQSLNIKEGSTIVWHNKDPVIYTLWFVGSNGRTIELSEPIPPDGQWEYIFVDEMEIQYYSFNRLWITGFISVSAKVHDVAVTNIVTSKSGCLPMPTVGKEHPVRVEVAVENQGDSIEDFTVTAYTNSIAIGEEQVILDPGENSQLTFTWDTSGFPYGNYAISATVEILPGESDTTDNTFTNDWILVTIPGDINGDKKVNLRDALILIIAYGSTPNTLTWNPNADINGDGVINIFDLIRLFRHFGKKW